MRRMRRSGMSFTALIGLCFLTILIGFLLGNYMINLMRTASEDKPEDQIQVITEDDLRGPAETESVSPYQTDMGGETYEVGDVSSLYRVQVGDFRDRDEGTRVKEELQSEGYPAFLTSSYPYRIQVGAFSYESNAEEIASELENKGYEVYITE